MDKNELRKQWKDRIESYHSSGLTMSAWCSANSFTLDQLKYCSIQARRKKLQRQHLSLLRLLYRLLSPLQRNNARPSFGLKSALPVSKSSTAFSRSCCGKSLRR